MEPRVGQAILYAMIAETRRHGTLDISLRSTVAKVIKTDNTVTGVVVQSLGAQGIASREVGCRTLIDATEWGDVIPLTGARYRVGNCVSDSIQPEREIQHLTWTAVIRQYPGPVPPALRITSAPPGYTEAVEKKFAAMPKAGGTVQLPPYDPKNKPWTFASFIAYRAMPDSARPECGLALTSTPINYSDLVAYRAILAASPITRTHMNYENDYPVHIRDVEDPASRTKTCREAQLRTLHLLYYVQHTLGETGWSVADDEGFDTPFRRAEVAAWLQDSPELQSYRVILNHFSVMAYARESRRTTGLSTRSKAASAMAIRSPSCLSLPREASHLRQPPHILPRSFITTE